jgi:isopenicillin N synthase-like dioxygenase
MRSLPVIDIAPLLTGSAGRTEVAQALDAACRDLGFFYVRGHGLAPEHLAALESTSRAFFALPSEEKLAIRMELGGRAWRGYFPLGGELTSGAPDQKEGIYFGTELHADEPRVRAGVPLHGANLFPARPAVLRSLVLDQLAMMTTLGHALLRGLALGLGLEPERFGSLMQEPTVLFRIFNYPAQRDARGWGVGEHTDYGLLTLLLQDDCGGLEVKTPHGWIEAPPIPGTLVCNLGDMLERMTGGRYRSTPHRVRNVSGRDRLSFPFFFDPGWDARVQPLFPPRGGDARWDGEDVFGFEGTYGDYLLRKVGRVFPELAQTVQR